MDDLYGAEGRALQQDVADYVAGINKYIAEARLDPTKLPAEYAAVGETLEDWKATDVIATAALVGGIFGKGGGREVDSADILAAARQRFGGVDGHAGLARLPPRRATRRRRPPCAARRFPYQVRHGREPGGGREARSGLARGGGRRGAERRGRWRASIIAPFGLLNGNSNALLVSAREPRPRATRSP